MRDRPASAHLFENADVHPMLRREAVVFEALKSLGFEALHTSPLAELRSFRRAKSALEVLYDAFGEDLAAFLTRPLADYGGKSVRDLVAEHGVRALEAIRSDVEYPTPA